MTHSGIQGCSIKKLQPVLHVRNLCCDCRGEAIHTGIPDREPQRIRSIQMTLALFVEAWNVQTIDGFMGDAQLATHVNLIKLSVGSESVESLSHWQRSAAAKGRDGFPRHVTRMWPRREPEILNGGSIYWVIGGMISCRQRILRFDEVIGGDGIRRCAIVLDPNLVRLVPVPKRPFQGWRYLRPEDSPPDIELGDTGQERLPSELNIALTEIGVLSRNVTASGK